MYSNCCCSCSFEPEIIKISQSSHKMYSNNILNFQESTTILNACTKKVWKLIERTTYVACLIFIVGNSTNVSNIGNYFVESFSFMLLDEPKVLQYFEST